ncbi:hypothetical protein Javan384_0044 [Streptococcus phage Javan384]|nr:hypothetical protein Javan384_0044 [Streptococcus phage Javan384]
MGKYITEYINLVHSQKELGDYQHRQNCYILKNITLKKNSRR